AAGGVRAGLARADRLLGGLGEAGVVARLWCVSGCAVAVGVTESPEVAAPAAVWGLGGVAALEPPRGWGGLIVLPPSVARRSAALLAAVIADRGGDDQLAVRPTGCLGRRLAATPGG
ncbi:hypothetical protein PUR71_10665, partial [Streptomyces sp. SP17BM10]|uniref:hypothetical protein n=1 Tax=Streptomyces sp. SP17BM10 TaxID=3002530 RepID=UPI002E776D0E